MRMFSCGVFDELLYGIETNQIQSYLAQKAHMEIGSHLLPRTLNFQWQPCESNISFNKKLCHLFGFHARSIYPAMSPAESPHPLATSPPIRLAVPSPYAPPVPRCPVPWPVPWPVPRPVPSPCAPPVSHARSRCGRARCPHRAAAPPARCSAWHLAFFARALPVRTSRAVWR